MSEKPNGKTENEHNEQELGESYEVDLSTLKPLIKLEFAGHDWKQRGPYLVCNSCELQHGVYIGTDRWFKGLNSDGSPIFQKVVSS
jgi:hypothetical protein